MTEDEVERILRMAYVNEIEVQLAKVPGDLELVGVHVIEPTYHELLTAVLTAILHGVHLVIIHSRVGWPYKTSYLG